VDVSSELEDTKGVIRSLFKKDRQNNGQTKKDKQRSAKHYTENKIKSLKDIIKVQEEWQTPKGHPLRPTVRITPLVSSNVFCFNQYKVPGNHAPDSL
jgi:hypothetical protein